MVTPYPVLRRGPACGAVGGLVPEPPLWCGRRFGLVPLWCGGGFWVTPFAPCGVVCGVVWRSGGFGLFNPPRTPVAWWVLG